MPRWLRYTLGFIALLVLALLLNRLVQWIRSPDVTTTDDGVTHVDPPRPMFPRGDSWTFADSTGETQRIRADRPSSDGVAIQIEQDTTTSEPVRLIVNRVRQKGFFPEFTGRRASIEVRALSGGRQVTVTQQSRSLLALEAVPLAGASLRARWTGWPVYGLPAGLSFLRIGPLHVGASVDLRALYHGRTIPQGHVTSTLYGPLSVGAGVALTPRVRPSVAIVVRLR